MESDTYLTSGRFHGRILGSLGASGFRMTEAGIEPGRKLPKHSHELAFFCLLLEGGYSEDYGSRSASYAPYTVAFHPPEESHRSEMGPHGARVFHVEIPGPWLASDGPGPLQPFIDLRGGEVTWLATRLFREYRNGPAGPPVVAEGLILEMLALTGRSAIGTGSGRPRWLSRAIDLLESEFRRSLRIGEIADEVGVHPAHLSRVFRRRVGLPIGEYVHRLRVRFVSQELQRPGSRLADVAAAAGFADQSHMTRVFRRFTGVTPRSFRDQR